MNDKFEAFTYEEWTALYKNGVLVCVGDHYHTDEYLRSYLGVVEHDDDSFLLGGNHYKDVAKTTYEIYEYKKEIERSSIERKIEELQESILKNQNDIDKLRNL